MVKDKALTLQQAIQRAQALCARQERCEYDIQLKLQQWQVAKEDIEKIIETLRAANFLNNQRYANMFVRDKSKFNKWGAIKIAYALKSKRIPEYIIRESLCELGTDDTQKTLTELLTKKAKHIKAKSKEDLKGKLIRYGMSRGFDYSTILSIIDKCY